MKSLSDRCGTATGTATEQSQNCNHPTGEIPTDNPGYEPPAQALTEWLERLHRRAVDRIQSGADRLTLETCRLEPDTVGGWPTWALISTAALPIPRELQNAYRAALLAVLADAAAALLIPWPDGGELADTWATALQRIELPSTRLLLAQQARLVSLDQLTATVEVQPTWLQMVATRRDLIATALGAVIGRAIAVVITPAEVAK